MNEELMIEFKSPCGSYVLTFEDNNKVAYAYLKHESEIVGVVWLYNRCLTPKKPEWLDKKNIPFANCYGYMSEEGVMKEDVEIDDVLVNWEQDENGPVAYIYIFENLYGVVGVNDMPGYARFATHDNPLARVMDIED